MNKSRDIDELIKAKIAFQKSVKTITKDAKNEFLKYKYVTLDKILEIINPVLSENGLTLIQEVYTDGVVTWLFHESGQYISTEPLKLTPEPGKKGLSAEQSVGVTITYARRYQLSSLLSITVDEDTDASLPKTASQEDLSKLYGLVKQIKNETKRNNWEIRLKETDFSKVEEKKVKSAIKSLEFIIDDEKLP